jgi:choline kinase
MSDAGPLVVLAAGLGRRFGGLKPLAPVGPAGEGVVEYTLWDALHAGFGPIVVVVRSATRREVELTLADHGVPLDELVLVEQDLDDTVPVRSHPWGTVHALVACTEVVPQGCAVVNGDDLYGRDPIAALARVAGTEGSSDHLVAHRWSQTRPVSGRANRGVCEIGPRGWLRSIREVRDLDADAELVATTPVSMNAWWFSAATVRGLGRSLVAFAADHGTDDDELTMPDAIGALVACGEAAVRVHVTDAPWMGVTFPDDLEHVRAGIRAEIAVGRYPASLADGWSARAS